MISTNWDFQDNIHPVQDIENSIFLLLAFGFSNSEGIKKIKKQWKALNGKVGRGRTETGKVSSEELGGVVSAIQVDMSTGDIYNLKHIDITCPMGLLIHGNELFIASEYYIQAFAGGEKTYRINNPFFNGLHAMKKSQVGNSFYVTCTNIDTLVEICLDGKGIKWRWSAPEYGYNTNKLGEKVFIDENRLYQYDETFSSTLTHTTHVNCIEEYSPDEILATLFHQGEVILINKNTRKITSILKGLTCPHGIHRFGDQFIVSDTKGNCTYLLDRNLKVLEKIGHQDFDWIQDSIILKDGNIVILNSNGGGIHLYDKNKRDFTHKVNFDPDKRRVSCAIELSRDEVEKIILE
ncbi:hypothetical protein JMN32_18905 [Fulvivirga sp. 29W222]|uniref:Uncharacterized protein n=1 Tax=Fulvivirga marina TaxID=2494733 RepID=A0A937G4Q2_9BACT|nr:hypothetical protein [Fulvivirga marina]MBL6448391.1 hypothetical protein [Fulvivirga marina]